MAKRSQAPSDATIPKRVFRDNFVIFRHRSKGIAFLESMNFSTCVYMQIFNFRDGHVTTLAPFMGQWYTICEMPGHRLYGLAKGFPSVPLVLGKTVEIVEGYCQNMKNAVFGSGFTHATKFWNFFYNSTRAHLHFDGLPPKLWRFVVSI